MEQDNPRANGAKRRSGHKPGARVTNSARLFTPGEMRAQRSAKFIKDCGRITLVHGWTSLISKIWRTVRSRKDKDLQKTRKKDYTHDEEKYFSTFL